MIVNRVIEAIKNIQKNDFENALIQISIGLDSVAGFKYPNIKTTERCVKIIEEYRAKTTGKYRVGGFFPKWNKSGKVFDSIGKIRALISGCITWDACDSVISRNDFDEWEIIEYEVVIKDTKSVSEVLKPEINENICENFIRYHI